MARSIPVVSSPRIVALVAALRAARSALGWSQGDLAAASGIAKVTIARLETAVISPRLSTVTALQDALERGGAQMVLHDPATGGGFSLRVTGSALMGSDALDQNPAEADPMEQGTPAGLVDGCGSPPP